MYGTGGLDLEGLAGKILVDFRSSEPIYLQIARQIEQLMTAGDLQPGDQLPTVRQLATDLRINFNTVTRAYHVLDESRLISTQRGRGTYVWETPSEETSRRIRAEGLQSATRRYLEQVAQLGFSATEVRENIELHLSNWEGTSPNSTE
jgi:GntR family transcriptional regulator